MEDLKVIDLFSGCGGSALGFKQAGFEIKVGVDNNPIASKTFEKNFPDAKVFCEDVTGLTGDILIKAAGAKSGKEILLLACPPCQGFSTARRYDQRLKEPRNFLIRHFIRLVGEIKPQFFVMENVPGLAKGIGKELFEEALKELEKFGYNNVDYKVINTADYGVPQQRKRLVLIGTNRKDVTISIPNQTNENPEQKGGILPRWVSVRDVISDLPAIESGGLSKNDKLHTSANLSETNKKRMKHTPHDGGGRSSWPEELILDCHKKSDGFRDVYCRMKWDLPSPTITGGCAMISKGRFGHPEQNRAISLREAARLQSFPDTFTFLGNFGNISSQIGNAVPPLLTRRIGFSLKRIMKATLTK